MMLSLSTAYRSFDGEVEASSTPTICRLPDSRRHQIWAIAPDIEKVPLDVNDLVREIIPLVQRQLMSHQVSLQMELAPALPMVLGDRVQLQQVLINLVMNGIEAMQSVTDRPRGLAIRSGQDEK